MQLLGVNLATTRIVSEEMATPTNSNIQKATIKNIIISLILGSMAGIIFVLCSSFISEQWLHNQIHKDIIYLIAIALPMISISSSISGYFTAIRKIYHSLIANFLEYGVKFVLTILLLKKYIPTGNINNICFALILGDVVSEVISFTYNILFLVISLNKFSMINNRFKDSYLYRILRILFPVAFTSYIRSGLSTIKQFLIPSSLEKSGLNYDKSLANYGTITGMVMPIIIFPSTIFSAISTILVPEFSRLNIRKEYSKIKKYTFKLLKISLFSSILIAIVFLFFGNDLALKIYKDLTIGNYLKIFAFLAPLIYIDIIIDGILKGLDAQVSVLFINIIDLIISIFFITVFVPILGITGFILSIFISELINFSLSLAKLLKTISKTKIRKC